MALNFPTNPTLGDVYTYAEGSWIWNGTSWTSGASLAGIQPPPNVTISDTAPIPITLGELWWDSATGKLKIYYDDGTSAQWVDSSSSLVTLLDYVSKNGADILTNKTISYSDNTLTGVAPLASPTFTGTVALPTTTSIGAVSSTEIGYVDGVTSSIQTQLNTKSPIASPTFTGTTTTGITDILGSVRGNVTTVAASSVDCSEGNYFIKTVSGALTWTTTNIPASRSYSFLLELTNGGTGAQTWFTGIKWPGGTAPTLTAAGVDVLGFITDDGGTTWRGVLLMKDSK